ncbi:MAG: cyclase family protein [Actinobacteria bacterium]|nr:cyclase family protein [Actinomycetota bacterium]
MTRHIDLSHVVHDGMQTYPGLPAPTVFEHLGREAAEQFYGPGVTFQIGMITMCSNTGTYIDVPFHRFADGHDLVGLPLERVSHVPGVCIDCRGVQVIGPEVLDGVSVEERAVLFFTGHGDSFGTPEYFVDHPHLAADTAALLVERGAAVVGIDSLNIDATDGSAGDGRPVHTTLLRAGVPIVEHLTGLAELPADGFTFTAVPPKVEGMGTFTVRAHAVLS